MEISGIEALPTTTNLTKVKLNQISDICNHIPQSYIFAPLFTIIPKFNHSQILQMPDEHTNKDLPLEFFAPF
jgi:hypothetical protein